MRLEDAALIHDTLLAAAKQFTNSADYLESDRYAEQQRAMAVDKKTWELSEHDRKQITTHRAKAVRLFRLVGA